MLARFPYIRVPIFTENIITDVKVLFLANGKLKTFDHAESIAKLIKIIAEQNIYKISIKMTK